MSPGGLGEALALALILGSASVVAKPPKRVVQSSWPMPHHSFERTLTYDDNLVHWFSSGATIALRNHIMLVPSVAQRAGILWHRDLVHTTDFEATFSFSVKGPAETDKDEAFAFWISPDNGTALFNEKEVVQQPDWEAGVKKINHVFINNRPNFHGLGVIFSCLDSTGKYRPSISGVTNNGHGKVTLTTLSSRGKTATFPVEHKGPENLPDIKATTNFVNWRASSSQESPVLFRVKVRPDGPAKKAVIGQMKLPSKGGEKTHGWIEIFHMEADLPNANFIGFSAATGSSGSKKPDEIFLHSLELENHDARSGFGEDSSDIKDSQDWVKMLEDDKHYISQKNQTEALEKLTSLVQQHSKRCHVMGQRLQNSLVTVDTKVHQMVEKTRVLQKEVQLAGMGGKEPPPDVAEMKNNIVGLRNIFSADSHKHKKSLEQVHHAVKTVKEAHAGGESDAKLAFAATKAESLQRHAEASQTQHSWMMSIVFFVVIAIGWLILNRMKYYEKKHFL